MILPMETSWIEEKEGFVLKLQNGECSERQLFFQEFNAASLNTKLRSP